MVASYRSLTGSRGTNSTPGSAEIEEEVQTPGQPEEVKVIMQRVDMSKDTNSVMNNSHQVTIGASNRGDHYSRDTSYQNVHAPANLDSRYTERFELSGDGGRVHMPDFESDSS